MKKFLALLVLLLFIILAWFSWKWYKETVICCDSTTETEVTEETTTTEVPSGPLVFNWNSGDVTTNNLWADKKAELLSGLSDGKILQITGPYFQGEENTTTFDNLGLARADAVRKLLLDGIAAENMEINSKLVDFFDAAKTSPFEGMEFSWLVRNENIQEIDNKALMYFPYKSTEKIDNENINSYLASVAGALEGNDKVVTLTGHTDNIGGAEYNVKLGLQRAVAIKNILVGLGVDPGRVQTASKGLSEPIATNDTEEGRQQNRRVELEIK